MTCKEAIEKDLCLGCMRLELENPNADKCKYFMEETTTEFSKRIIEGEQIRL